jgi:hypothetical protein
MLILVWDRWPQFFRGRLRVLYELTGEVRHMKRRSVVIDRDGGRELMRVGPKLGGAEQVVWKACPVLSAEPSLVNLLYSCAVRRREL